MCVNDANSPIAKMTALATSALAALKDLHAGYPWKELHVNVERLLAEAKELGIDLDDVQDGD